MEAIQFNGKNATQMMLNGNVIWSASSEEESPYYVEYKINNSDSTHYLDQEGGGVKLYLPQIYLTSTDSFSFNYERIEITLTDNTVITGNLHFLCSNIAKIKLWYPESTVAVKFVGASNNTNYHHRISELCYIKTDNFTDMSAMFFYCSSLTSLVLSHFNTSNVTSMDSMFTMCKKLTSLNLSNFNTDNVTSMKFMFRNCSGLTSLNLSNFNTNSVTDMGLMFDGCSGLTSIDVSSFNTDNVTSMSNMFSSCRWLTSIDVSSFNTSNLTNMSYMFYNCSSLTSLDLSNFNTTNVTNMSNMFSSCRGLTSLNLSNFNTTNVTSMDYMFYNCTSLTSLNLSNFNTNKVTNSYYMLQNVPSSVNWNYNGTNYQNWWLTEKKSYFSGTFPWARTQYTVTIDYQDEYGDDFYDRDDYTGTISHGQPYDFSTRVPNVIGSYYETYILTNTSGSPISGIATGNISIVAKYRRGRECFVYIYYRDRDTKALLASNEDDYRVYEGQSYDFSSEINEMSFDGYIFDSTSGSPISGTAPINNSGYSDDMSITVYYKKVIDTSRDYIRYKISSNSNSDYITAVNNNDSLYKKYLPTLYNSSNIEVTNLELTIEKNDGTWTNSLETLAKDVKSIVVYYNYNNGEYFSFRGYNSLQYHRITEFIVHPRVSSSVNRLDYIFYQCRLLQEIDVSGWNTINVTSMRNLFAMAITLSSIIGIAELNVSNVTNMSYMFDRCDSLTSLDLSKWNTMKVTDANAMFNFLKESNCPIYVGDNWNPDMTESVTFYEGTYGEQAPLVTLIDWENSNPTLPGWIIEQTQGTYTFTRSSVTYSSKTYTGLVPSNRGKDNTTAWKCYRVVAPITGTLKVTFTNYAESNFDYTVLYLTQNTTQPSVTSEQTNCFFFGKGKQNANKQIATTSIVTGATYYLHIQYKKDGSSSDDLDAGVIHSLEIY